MVPDLSARLSDLARRVGRLRQDRRNPERFHMDKDEIERELHGLARQVRGAVVN